MPRQHSSGGKPRWLGLTQRGGNYWRMLWVHGARAVVSQASRRDDRFSQWIQQLKTRRGMHIAVVAVANKTARVLWALLDREEDYRVAA